ncbi:hypothetical protein KI387_009258, partial [Taxus chinensis]
KSSSHHYNNTSKDIATTKRKRRRHCEELATLLELDPELFYRPKHPDHRPGHPQAPRYIPRHP